MSLKELNSAEIEQVSGGTFLLKAFLLSRLFNPQGSGCNTCNSTNPAPVQPQPPVIDSPCSSGDFGFNKWFKIFKF